jgi:CPA1 family monovalent cation:H+ antiporter
LPLSYCLLFGALISPTDPIAVLNLFKVRRVPWSLEATMAGESLFNDGVAVVMFSVLLEVVRMGSSGEAVSAGHVLVLFARQSAGGILLGLALGFVVFQLLKRIDSYPLEISITIAAVMGGYALAEALDTSGPLSMVAAGILVGNQGKSFAMSETTRRNLEVFWEVVDELLNAVLFVMIGLEALLISLKPGPLVAGLVLIPIVLLSRLLTAGLPIRLLRGRFRLPRGSALFVTWCGLRGGISIALALSLPPGPERSVIVLITYVIVVFAIIVQGLSAGRLLRMLRLEHPKNGLDDRTEP